MLSSLTLIIINLSLIIMIDYTKYSDIVYKIIGASMAVHSELRWGLLEPIYQEALHLELSDRGIENQREQEITIQYKHHILEKKYKMDIVVGDIVVELKSVAQLSAAHRAQLCNYLRLTRMPVGLLINFGEKDLMAERWVYDEKSNECFLVDRRMRPIDVEYKELLDREAMDGEGTIQ